MATRTQRGGNPGERMGKRTRLTIDVDPELFLHIKVAAAQNHVTIREYVERVLERFVVSTTSLPQERRRPVTEATLERLLRTRAAVMRGRRFTDDSADLLHEAREEHLADL